MKFLPGTPAIYFNCAIPCNEKRKASGSIYRIDLHSSPEERKLLIMQRIQYLICTIVTFFLVVPSSYAGGNQKFGSVKDAVSSLADPSIAMKAFSFLQKQQPDTVTIQIVHQLRENTTNWNGEKLAVRLLIHHRSAEHDSEAVDVLLPLLDNPELRTIVIEALRCTSVAHRENVARRLGLLVSDRTIRTQDRHDATLVLEEFGSSSAGQAHTILKVALGSESEMLDRQIASRTYLSIMGLEQGLSSIDQSDSLMMKAAIAGLITFTVKHYQELSQIDWAKSASFLVSALASSQVTVRQAAAVASGQVFGKYYVRVSTRFDSQDYYDTVIARLSELSHGDTSQEVRQAAADALNGGGPDTDRE